MTLRPQGEIAAIRRHLDSLKSQPWLDEARRWWPDFLFHCTDVENVVSILCQGGIKSRSLVTKTGQLPVDIASPDIIGRTEAKWQQFVRLYFRPKAPTQFNNEGFRPIGQRVRNSHCAVPVYLLFDALAVLSRVDSRFSDGNLGSTNPRIDGDVSFLNTIPFEFVYHDTRFDQSEHRQIIYHRHAEVLVPQRMGLTNLRYVVCRSEAEYKTLSHLLPPRVLSHWRSRIGVWSGLQLFHRKWTFVEKGDMNKERIIVRFNRSSLTPSPFDARIDISEVGTGMRYSWHNRKIRCDKELTLNLSRLQDPFDYTVRLYLDDKLAFADHYLDDLPF